MVGTDSARQCPIFEGLAIASRYRAEIVRASRGPVLIPRTCSQRCVAGQRSPYTLGSEQGVFLLRAVRIHISCRERSTPLVPPPLRNVGNCPSFPGSTEGLPLDPSSQVASTEATRKLVNDLAIRTEPCLLPSGSSRRGETLTRASHCLTACEARCSRTFAG